VVSSSLLPGQRESACTNPRSQSSRTTPSLPLNSHFFSHPRLNSSTKSKGIAVVLLLVGFLAVLFLRLEVRVIVELRFVFPCLHGGIRSPSTLPSLSERNLHLISSSSFSFRSPAKFENLQKNLCCFTRLIFELGYPLCPADKRFLALFPSLF